MGRLLFVKEEGVRVGRIWRLEVRWCFGRGELGLFRV